MPLSAVSVVCVIVAQAVTFWFVRVSIFRLLHVPDQFWLVGYQTRKSTLMVTEHLVSLQAHASGSRQVVLEMVPFSGISLLRFVRQD